MEQFHDVVEPQGFLRKAVFDIRNAVADIVRSFHQESQGMAAPAKVVSFRLRSGEIRPSLDATEGGGSSFLDAYAELFAFQCIGVRKKTFVLR